MITVAVIGQKGGSGKTSAARMLAVELADRGKRVAAIDTDIRQRTFLEWSQARELNELEPVVAVELIDIETEPDLRLAEFRDDGVEWVVIDAPGWIDRSLIEIARMADAVVVPTACSEDELRPTMRLYHELIEEGVRSSRVLILLNRVGTDAEARRARAKLAEGEIPETAVLGASIPDLPIYRSGQDGGQAAQEVSSKGPRETASKAAAEIVSRIEKATARVEPRRFAARNW